MTDLAVVEVPQWRGSGAVTAHRLREGARLLAGLVPGTAERVEVADAAGDAAFAANAANVRAALGRTRGRPVFVAGGDCGVELAPVAAALRRYGDRLAVVWFDAHGDLNTPASSPSGAFHGMVLRTLLGEGPAGLVPDRPLRPGQVVLAGVRALDPAERAYAEAEGLPIVADPDALVAAVGDADAVYVHLDLDVLDPETFASVGTPEPGGLTPGQVIEMVAALADRFEIAGVGVTEYEPARPRDQETLAGLVGGVVAAYASSEVRAIERRAFAAWPAGSVREEAGWLLRHTPGVGRRRSNSAVPVSEASIEHLEAFYRSRGRPAMVQLGGPAHAELDARLADRGYVVDAPTSVLTASTADVVAATREGSAELRERADWLTTFAELDEHTDSALIGEKVISRIAAPAGFISATRDGRAAGMGLFAADSGWAGVFAMATRPECRGRGVATEVLGAGARWALAQGATRLYLQVEDGNAPAGALYGRAGFVRSHGYHYRIRR
ncbi:GNAT family N-acetyltransferase [Actinomadura sp. DC4]|uniref:GNAT family N-acetyltransferase n=1 Tax=Actinomadura sp. DC4 TaxID=3055069 RepID=UPI0025B1BEA0|nr:GNAT family N-acetyltransferase [Actinomadura sp. DC4]MDN3352828.1 GNAT family N-acetyltransferase [Actinomadura sp. DC4]